jgi:phage terminase large subunit-like protein
VTEESLLERVAGFAPEQRRAWLADEAAKSNISPDELSRRALTNWRYRARPKQLAPAGDWVFWYLMAGRGFGKLLHEETRLPTPSGWVTMRDVRVGDLLLDEQGCPTRVTWKSERRIVEAYRLTFSDGSSILACADHQWTTWDKAARKAYLRSAYEDSTRLPDDWPAWRVRRAWRRDREPQRVEDGPGPRVRTTAQLAFDLRRGVRGDLNHSIPVAAPLDLPEADLPIDPYVLGYWLGDGTTISGQLTIHPDDQTSFFKEAAAFSPRRLSHPNDVGTRGLRGLLREEGLLGNKHVPAAYLRGSIAQRLALLQGLMDSDGHAVAQTSHVEFASSLPQLAEAVMELATSLGQKPSLSDGPSFLNGRECKRRYRVTWRPTLPVFRLPRKADRCRPLGRQAFRSLHRMIVNIEPTGVDLPMYCVAVGSPHRIYLAGDAMIPTHNTVSAAQWARARGLEAPRRRIAVIAPTLGDVRATCFEGETGLLSVFADSELLGGSRSVAWNKSLLELTLANGTIYKGFGSEEPNRLRGPQHHYAWCEETSSWKDAAKGAAVGSQMDTTWSNMTLGLRLGVHPRAVLTSTPKANRLTRELVELTKTRAAYVLVRGSSYENRENLSDVWWQEVVAPLEGTRTGRQEIEAELLEDVEGALWTRAAIDAIRVEAPVVQGGWQRVAALRDEWGDRMRKIVVGVDPNTTSGESADAAGIVVVGLGEDGLGYVLDDRTQIKGGPKAWAAASVDAFHDWKADKIVAESNNGGEMVELTIKGYDSTVPVRLVTASRGKRTRAEPISALYFSDVEHEKQATIRHVGAFPELEDEMTTWTPADESPNRMDALVWGFWELKMWKPATAPHGSFVAKGDIPGIVPMGAGVHDY